MPQFQGLLLLPSKICLLEIITDWLTELTAAITVLRLFSTYLAKYHMIF